MVRFPSPLKTNLSSREELRIPIKHVYGADQGDTSLTQAGFARHAGQTKKAPTVKKR